MDKNIIKADLLAISPKEINQEIKVELTFNEIARYSAKELLKITISLEEWLQFLENCFIQFNDTSHIFTSNHIILEEQKSQVQFIGDGTHAFAIPKNKWKQFIEKEVEKLFHLGIIST